jgi:hypothetical protein
MLDHEDQYRRSEEPYPGPEEFSAAVLPTWGEGELYIAIAVTAPDPVFRSADAPPLFLDNEPDDIHGDGVQLYLRPEPRGPVYGFLVVPDPAGRSLRVRGASGTAGRPEMVRGAWERTDTGYTVTLAVAIPGWDPRAEDELGFDAGEPHGSRARSARRPAGVERRRRLGISGDGRTAALGVLELR